MRVGVQGSVLFLSIIIFPSRLSCCCILVLSGSFFNLWRNIIGHSAVILRYVAFNNYMFCLSKRTRLSLVFFLMRKTQHIDILNIICQNIILSYCCRLGLAEH